MKLQKNDSIEQKLWDEFDKVKNMSKDSASYIKARNDLIEYHYEILEEIGKRMAKSLKDITAEEITSYGLDGMIDAIQSYDRSMNVKFKTWSAIRIRGSVIDNIRKSDWVPRLVRHRHSRIERIRDRIEMLYGDSNDLEIAKELGITVEEYLNILRKSTPITQVSMNVKSKSGKNEDYDEIGEILTESRTKPVDDNLIRIEMYKKLFGKNFTKPEIKIMDLHYFENMTMKEIANHTGFSESRISQMHADILRRLKKKVECNPVYASDLQRLLES